MGNLTKVYALFQSSFWLEEGFSGEVVSNGGPGYSNLKINCENGPVQIIFDATTSSGTPALVGFIAGKSSDQWNDLGTFKYIDYNLEFLERIQFMTSSFEVFNFFNFRFKRH